MCITKSGFTDAVGVSPDICAPRRVDFGPTNVPSDGAPSSNCASNSPPKKRTALATGL